MTQSFPSLPQEVRGRLAGDSRAGSTTGIAGLGTSVEASRWIEDGWRQQRTPGAYEWWYFDTLDAAGNGVSVTFYDGFCYQPTFLMHQARSRRRLKHGRLDTGLRDAQPEFYPAVQLCVYQGNRCVTQFINQYPAGAFEGNADLPELRIGPNRVTLRQDGSFGVVARGYPMRLTARGPRYQTDQVLSVSLNFVPTFPGVQEIRSLRANGADGSQHQWIIAAPHARVTGRVQHINTQDDVALLDMPIDAMGYHDHAAGSSGFHVGMKRWTWGRVLGENWALVWLHSQMHNDQRSDAAMLFSAGARPIIIDAPVLERQRPRLSSWFLRYAGRLLMHGSDAHGNSAELICTRRNVLESSPYRVRTLASASFIAPGRADLAGRGISDTVQAKRLRWPILSDMMLMSVYQIRADDPLWRQ